MKLKESLDINGMHLENRLVMPPMATAKSDRGNVTDALCRYYAARAEGSTPGLIITEHSYISPSGIASPNQLSIASDSDVEGLHRLTDAIHAAGTTKVIAQINHAGSSTYRKIIGQQPVAPNAIPHPTALEAELPRELTPDEIQQIVTEFAAAAGRAKAAGYDGVEIHSAHGYLLNQFYSPMTNQRLDQYGGSSVEERLTLLKEVMAAVRQTVGSNFPMAVRLGGADYLKGGNTVKGSIVASQVIEEAGADLLDLSGGMCRYMIVDEHEPGFFKEMTLPIKKAVSIPVILTGGIRTREQAESLLEEQAADLIGIGRPLLKDAHYAQHLMG